MDRDTTPPSKSSSAMPIGAILNDAETKGIQYVDTIEAYNQWAEVYDSDGNFLQALDSLEMQALLPSFLEQVARSTDKTLPECKFVDLGCGTGRNTLVLQRAAPQSRIIGLEPSEKMREIARQRMDEQIASSSSDGGKEEQQLVSFEAYDMLQQKQTNEAPVADGVISTLVLEHVPLSTFFTSAASMLTPNGGILLLTNMHSAMGAISQAGFVHPVTKVKIRPTSYAHTVDEVIAAAREAGLELVGSMKEVEMDGELAEKLGPRARKWVGVKVWFGGCFVRRR